MSYLSPNKEGAIKTIIIDCLLRQTNVLGAWMPELEKAEVSLYKNGQSDGWGADDAPLGTWIHWLNNPSGKW